MCWHKKSNGSHFHCEFPVSGFRNISREYFTSHIFLLCKLVVVIYPIDPSPVFSNDHGLKDIRWTLSKITIGVNTIMFFGVFFYSFGLGLWPQSPSCYTDIFHSFFFFALTFNLLFFHMKNIFTVDIQYKINTLLLTTHFKKQSITNIFESPCKCSLITCPSNPCGKFCQSFFCCPL